MGRLVAITRAQALERLAEVDAILDMLDTYNEEALMVERDQLIGLLGDD